MVRVLAFNCSNNAYKTWIKLLRTRCSIFFFKFLTIIENGFEKRQVNNLRCFNPCFTKYSCKKERETDIRIYSFFYPICRWLSFDIDIYIYIYTLWSIWTALLSFVTKKKKKEKEINVSLQINSLTSVIRILAVQFPGYLFKHILVAVEPANSRTATLHLLPSPRRSPTILGRINSRLPGNRNEAAGNKSGCS